jgi:hypothetical protein
MLTVIWECFLSFDRKTVTGSNTDHRMPATKERLSLICDPVYVGNPNNSSIPSNAYLHDPDRFCNMDKRHFCNLCCEPGFYLFPWLSPWLNLENLRFYSDKLLHLK